MRYPPVPLRSMAAVLLLVSACAQEPRGDQPAERPPERLLIGMIGVPVFRPSQRVAQNLTGEAIETVFRSDAGPETIAAWYRRVLRVQGWQIVGDALLPDGSRSLYAQLEGRPPLWITIRRGSVAGTSEFSVIGAAPDTTVADTASGGR